MTDLELIADNFHLISEKTRNIAAVFYRCFFGKHPELEDADWVKSNMEALGLRHQGYEVSDAMYDMWIDALVETLRELSGDGWSERLERVWREQLGVVCGFARRAQFTEV